MYTKGEVLKELTHARGPARKEKPGSRRERAGRSKCRIGVEKSLNGICQRRKGAIFWLELKAHGYFIEE